MKNKIACCYFPTTVLFVDDKERFLDGLTFELDENLAFQTYTDPDAVLALLEDRCMKQPEHNWLLNLKEKFTEEFPEEYGHTVVDVNISDIYQQVYSSDRFLETSVVAVDYAMPSKNGLELAKQIKQNYKDIKILMVTGEATDELAIEAFNDGVLDKFIKKSAANFAKLLNDAVSTLQAQYFNDLSASIIGNLVTHQDCCLNDVIFIDFFNKLKQEKKIVEYYLIDELGGFLLLDITGKLSWLIVKTDNIMNNYYNIAKDNYASKIITQSLLERKKLPFFFTNIDMEQPVKQWKSYLHPAQKLIGQKNIYYYAVIDGKGIYDIKKNKILSYQDYLNALDA